MFIAFHLSISFVVDVDLRSDACGISPWIWFAWYGACKFRECFGKSLYGRNLLLMILDFVPLLPRDIGFSTNEGGISPRPKSQQIYKRFSKFAYVDVCMGKCLLTSCDRVIQKKTLNPFYVNTFWLDALLQ